MTPAGPDLDTGIVPDYSFPSHPSRTPRELFREGYVETMLWANCAVTYELADRTPAYRGPGVGQIDADPPAAILGRLREDADDFLSDPDTVAYIAEAIAGADSYGWDSAGIDFALTRNGHGAGFWDRGLPGETGERLTELAGSYGESTVSVWVPFNPATGTNFPDDDPAVSWEVF